MDAPHILSFIFGTVFLSVLLGLGVAIMLRERPVPVAAMFIFRVVLALAAGGFGAVLPGLISLQIGQAAQFALQAGGALALTALVFLVNPPVLVEGVVAKSQPQPGKLQPRRRNNVPPPPIQGSNK
jgi:hypothetical protein